MEVTKKGKKDWIVKSKSGVSLFMGISLKKKNLFSSSEKQKQKVILACSHRNLDLNVYSSCMHNGQKLKQPRCQSLGE